MLKNLLLGVLGFSLLFVSDALAKSGGDDDDKPELEFRGTITELSADELQLGEKIFSLSEGTEYEAENGDEISLEDFAVGDFVKVKAIRTDDGFLALEVEIESDSGGSSGGGEEEEEEETQEYRGTITELSESSVTIDALVLLVDENTKYEDENSEHGGQELLTVGAFVEAKAIQTELGLYATKIELEDEDDDNSGGGKTPKYNSKKGVKEKSRANLVPESAVDAGAEGNVKSRNRTQENNERQRITSKLFFPLPSNVPAIADEASAEAQSFTLEISRAGALFTLCTYEYDHSEDDDGTFGAEYKIDIRYRLRKNDRETLTAKKGSCDIDLVTEGTQLGIPNLKTGDTFEVFWQGDAEQLVFTGVVE